MCEERELFGGGSHGAEITTHPVQNPKSPMRPHLSICVIQAHCDLMRDSQDGRCCFEGPHREYDCNAVFKMKLHSYPRVQIRIRGETIDCLLGSLTAFEQERHIQPYWCIGGGQYRSGRRVAIWRESPVERRAHVVEFVPKLGHVFKEGPWRMAND